MILLVGTEILTIMGKSTIERIGIQDRKNYAMIKKVSIEKVLIK